MYKGPAGYNPDLGDYWFGVTDVRGVPLTDDQGRQRVGRMTECYSCHADRAEDDDLFGVPAIHRRHSAR